MNGIETINQAEVVIEDPELSEIKELSERENTEGMQVEPPDITYIGVLQGARL